MPESSSIRGLLCTWDGLTRGMLRSVTCGCRSRHHAALPGPGEVEPAARAVHVEGLSTGKDVGKAMHGKRRWVKLAGDEPSPLHLSPLRLGCAQHPIGEGLGKGDRVTSLVFVAGTCGVCTLLRGFADVRLPALGWRLVVRRPEAACALAAAYLIEKSLRDCGIEKPVQ